MGPADLAPNTAPPETETPEQSRVVERNSFYNSLPPEAKAKFLSALEEAAGRGLSEDVAWKEAVRAAQFAYRGEPHESALRNDLPPEP